MLDKKTNDLQANAQQILDCPEFRALVINRRRFSIGLIATMMIIYFGFILLIAFNKPFLAQWSGIGEKIPIGIPIGISIIVIAWIIIGIFVFWANRYYDPHVAALKKKFFHTPKDS